MRVDRPGSGPAAGPDDVRFLLWSNKHGKWWKAYAAGYTDNLDEAGRYLMGDAIVIVTKAAYHGRVDQATVMIAAPPQDNG